MKLVWFKKWGWIYQPISVVGLLVYHSKISNLNLFNKWLGERMLNDPIQEFLMDFTDNDKHKFPIIEC